MSDEKTEKPTTKRRRENRRKGQVARTADIGGWGALLVLGLFLPGLFKIEVQALMNLWGASLRSLEDPSTSVATQLLGQALWHCMLTLVVVSSIVLIVGVAGALAQGGFYIARDRVKPDLKHLNLVKGLKKTFGPAIFWEGGKMLIKATIVAWFGYEAVRSLLPMLGGFMRIEDVLEVVRDKTYGLLRSIGVAALLMAAADYAMQRRRVGKQTRMSKKEVKDEHKQSEGDPMLKGQIRSRQLAAARNRMIADVKDADVVMVNPTHVAVALKYDRENGAPKVIAKGQGVVAGRIRAEADQHQVPMVRDVPLARALHASCELGQQIPPELFAAVAQVLAFVFTRREHGRRGGEHLSPRAGTIPEIARRTRRGRTLSGTVKVSDED